ncbi:MAG TPA: S46 family peptidase, partial [Polyangia bacterium]
MMTNTQATGRGWRSLPALLLLAACRPAAPTQTAAVAVAAAAPAAARPRFENPGGMWLPEQLAAQAASLRAAGLALDPATLGDPMRYPVGSVVSLGGCSASFVSADGLIITNHHCAVGALQANSTPQRNLIETGYLAHSPAEELWNGPTGRVYVTMRLRDVSADVRAGLTSMATDRQRFDAVENRSKTIVADCEKGRPSVRCSVASQFGGAGYTLIEQLELRDVRLVYAPHGQ